jgi:hypothetical protein
MLRGNFTPIRTVKNGKTSPTTHKGEGQAGIGAEEDKAEKEAEGEA